MRNGPLALGAALAAPLAATLLAGPRARSPFAALLRPIPDPPPARLRLLPPTRRDAKRARRYARKLLRASDGLAAPLFTPVDAAYLVWFRGVFGLIGFWEVTRYFRRGWIDAYYVRPRLHFTYYGFGWVRPWPGVGMRLHFAALGGCSLLIALGLWYRVASALFAVGFTYVFLLDETRYLNHFYLISLVSGLMAAIPAHRAGSLDALLRPALRSATLPAWCLWLLRAQIAVAYFYGGVAKLNSDWLRGEPMRRWLAAREDFPVIGRWFRREWMVYAFAYGGLLLDLLIVPLILWRRTLPFALPAVAAFHLLNDELFKIGVFPWFMLAASVLYVPPTWLPWRPAGAPAASAAPTYLAASQRATAALVAAHLAGQLLLPFRHHLYPGNVSWTEEGHRFAWHMKLRTKRATATFHATDPASGQTVAIDPLPYLARHQRTKMPTHPDMVLQFAHYLARAFRDRGFPNVEVRAEVRASLNGRPRRPLIDPTVDLARERRTLRPARWILPLDEPLRRSAGSAPDTRSAPTRRRDPGRPPRVRRRNPNRARQPERLPASITGSSAPGSATPR